MTTISLVPLPQHVRFDLANNPPLTYLPALDGMRALAVLAVMLFHVKSKPLFPGGGIGVDVFFVLSGFLITTLLLQEWAGSGGISLKNFYLRRGLRLLPAVAFYLAIYATVSIGFRDFDFSGRRPIDVVLANLASIATYSYNWFIGLGGERGLGISHLWSLSIEEQFYLAWPFLLLALLRLRVTPVAIMAFSLAVVMLSALLPPLLLSDWERIYYGTDFRLQGLVLGALLAECYVAGVIRPGGNTAASRIATPMAVAVLIVILAVVHNQHMFLFWGGHTVVAICSALILLALLPGERSAFSPLLSNRVLLYVGRRSYALYLWHASIGSWLRDIDAVPQVLATLALSFFAAEVSYRLVERPALSLKSRFKRETADAEKDGGQNQGLAPAA